MSFYTAARDGQVDVLRSMLERKANVHERFNDDRTALHFACDGGMVEIVCMLLDYNADVNMPDVFNKDTPLHLASEGGHTDVVEVLLRRRADPNAQDQMNAETPLHLACEGGHADVVALLLQNGADVNIKNTYGKEAAHYATRHATRVEFEKYAALRAVHTHFDHQQEPHQGSPEKSSGVAPLSSVSPEVQHEDDSDELEEQLRETVASMCTQTQARARASDAPEQLDKAAGHYEVFTQHRVPAGVKPYQRTHLGSIGGQRSWFGAHSIAGFSTAGLEKDNQDAHLLVPELGGDKGLHMFGVFDGHGRNGNKVSQLAKDSAASFISVEAIQQARKLDAEASTLAINEALTEVFSKLQSLIEFQVDFDATASGCTALIVLAVDGDIFVANAGDSRAVLAHAKNDSKLRKGKGMEERVMLQVTQVSTDHNPSIREEKERIETMGGMVRREADNITGEAGPYRVWRRDMQGPGLAMSRSLGDINAHKIGVTHLPEIRHLTQRSSDRLLLIATDGVWDMLENEEAVDIAARASGDCRGDPFAACLQLCETARRAWEFKETRIDDITALVVFLPLPVHHDDEQGHTATSTSAAEKRNVPSSTSTPTNTRAQTQTHAPHEDACNGSNTSTYTKTHHHPDLYIPPTSQHPSTTTSLTPSVTAQTTAQTTYTDNLSTSPSQTDTFSTLTHTHSATTLARIRDLSSSPKKIQDKMPQRTFLPELAQDSLGRIVDLDSPLDAPRETVQYSVSANPSSKGVPPQQHTKGANVHANMDASSYKNGPYNAGGGGGVGGLDLPFLPNLFAPNLGLLGGGQTGDQKEECVIQ